MRLLLLRSAAAASAAAASAAAVKAQLLSSEPTMLSLEKLNQRGPEQSLDNWTIQKDVSSGEHYIVRVCDPTVRHRAPDGGNWVEGVPHPPFIQQKSWTQLNEAWATSIHRLANTHSSKAHSDARSTTFQ